MSLFAPADELFNWLERNRVCYVVLRDGHRLKHASNAVKDLDLLIDDDAITRLKMSFSKKRHGLKVDCYGVRGLHGSDYHGYPHLPESLGERILANRRRVDNLWLPQPLDELNALLYHVVYHKNLQSGFDAYDLAHSTTGPYTERLSALQRECGVTLTATHECFHAHLESQGLAVCDERLVAYLQHDFSQRRKSFFHAWLQNRHRGELNLFVIRGVAVRQDKSAALLDFLADKFQLVASKQIRWWARVINAKHMRGGKWRRGGKPHIAVVVFDPDPVPSTREERKVHPFVFNRNQFVKLQWREWFCANTSACAKDNPIHSTDNEAEALGHLPLFFTLHERLHIMEKLGALRSEVHC